jgi:hypothetical protein
LVKKKVSQSSTLKISAYAIYIYYYIATSIYRYIKLNLNYIYIYNIEGEFPIASTIKAGDMHLYLFVSGIIPPVYLALK